MESVLATVRNGRLAVDAPSTLPEGTEVVLTLVETSEQLDREHRERLNRVLERSEQEAAAGLGRPATEFLAELKARHTPKS